MTSRTIHILKTGVSVPTSKDERKVALRGETLTLTEEMIDSTRGRDGASLFDPHPEERGEVRWAEERSPADIEIGDDDPTIVARRREQARRDALAITNRAEQIAALREVNDKYGRPLTSQSLGVQPGTKW